MIKSVKNWIRILYLMILLCLFDSMYYIYLDEPYDDIIHVTVVLVVVVIICHVVLYRMQKEYDKKMRKEVKLEFKDYEKFYTEWMKKYRK